MVARPDGAIDWLFNDQDYGYTDFYATVDTLLIGRKTFEQVLTFAEYPYPDKKVYVLSRRGFDAHVAGAEVTGDLSALIRDLKAGPGRDIWCVGGADVADQILAEGEMDELIVSIHPVVLGRGVRLFAALGRQVALRLTGTQAFDTGLVQLRYDVDRARR